MRKADKRRIGEQKQAENRELNRRIGLMAQRRDRENRQKSKEEKETGGVKVRKLPKKDGPKKFGPVETRNVSVPAASQR